MDPVDFSKSSASHNSEFSTIPFRYDFIAKIKLYNRTRFFRRVLLLQEGSETSSEKRIFWNELKKSSNVVHPNQQPVYITKNSWDL
jgi:hypothetical protein